MIHLHTVVGERVTTLAPMLEHYRALGIESFHVNVHVANATSRLADEVEEITRRFGTSVASVTVGEWQSVIQAIYTRSRERYPRDWHILADQDELQVYPMPLLDLLELCCDRGYDYVTGCFLDRFAADGCLPELRHEVQLWRQFPVAAFFSYPAAGADPRKVTLAKGHVQIVKGQHHALNGTPCPIDEVFVQVHHFKWVAELLPALARRALELKAGGHRHYVESLRLFRLFSEHGGKADLGDPRFLAAEWDNGYRHWLLITSWFAILSKTAALNARLQAGPALGAQSAAVVRQRFAELERGIEAYLAEAQAEALETLEA